MLAAERAGSCSGRRQKASYFAFCAPLGSFRRLDALQILLLNARVETSCVGWDRKIYKRKKIKQ